MQPGSEWGVHEVTKRVTNRQIKAAIERDGTLGFDECRERCTARSEARSIFL